jgi:quinol monooxygenase YgiN
VEILKRAAQYALDNEPGVLKYYATQPKDEAEGASIVMIEEYVGHSILQLKRSCKKGGV